jgi:hypothetical protein
VRRLVTIALVGLLAVGCGGCGGDGGDDGASSSTTRRSESTASPTTPTTRSPESEVEEAYLAYWEMGERLLEAPDPDDPEIAQRAIDPARGQMVDSLTTLKARDQAVQRGPEYAHNVLSVHVTGETATVRDCVVDDGAVISVVSGATVRERVTTVLLETTLRRDGARWRVSAIDQRDSWEGASTCDA